MALTEKTKGLINERERLFNSSLDNETSRLLGSIYPKKFTASSADPSSLYIPVPLEQRNIERYVGQTYDPTMPGLENYAAYQQSKFNRWAGFVPKIGVKIASEMVQLPGYVVGLADWATTGFQPEEIGRMVDNAWLQGVQEIEKQVKDKAFPVYIPDSVKNGNLWDNITSASFWTTEGADAIGFLTAMLIPGQLIKAAGVGAKTAKILGKGAKFAGQTDVVAATVVNTVYEAAAEGGETYRDVLRETGSKEMAGAAAADVVQKNMLILLGPNAVQQAFFFNGFKRGKQVASSAGKGIKNKALDRLLDPNTKAILAEVAPKSKWAKSAIIGKKALTGLVSEGFFEEGLQFATSEAAKEKITSGEEYGFLEDVWNVLETYADHISDTEMQKSIFLGAFMGTTMGIIGGKRDVKQEERLLKGQTAKEPSVFGRFLGQQARKESVGLHELLRRNYINRTRTMADLAKTDADGKPIVNKDTGKYILDPQKVKEAGVGAVESMVERKQLQEFSINNDEENFRATKSKMDFEYMLPFLSQEGGLEILKTHIENLAEADAVEAKDNGFLLQDGAEIKADLLDKAERFQAIYNKITDTHETSLKIKPAKEDRAEFNNFSQKVLDGRMSNTIRQSHFAKRISTLANELESSKVDDTTIPITSTEKQTTDKFVEGLKESLKENAKDLSKADIHSANKKINAIEALTKAYQTAKNSLDKELYNTAYLKDAWSNWVKDKKVYEKAEEDAKKATDPNVAQLTPELKKLYDEATLEEELVIGGVPYKATHKAKLGITITNEEGKKEQLEFTVEGATKSGNLQLRQGNNISNFLNQDGTLFTNNKSHKIKMSEVEFIQSAEDIRDERHYQAMLNSLEQNINLFRNSINRIDKRIETGVEYIQDLINKAQDLEQKEINSLLQYNTILTTTGKARKQSILLSREIGKNVRQKYLTAKEIQDEIIKARETLEELRQLKSQREAKLQSTIAEFDVMKVAEGFVVEDLEEAKSLLTFQGQQTTRTLDQYSDIVENLEKYIPKLRSTLRGYHTTAGRLLGITDQIDAVRGNPNLSPEDQEQAVTDLIASEMLSAGEFTNEEYEQLLTLSTNVDNITDKINTAQESLAITNVEIEGLKTKLDNLRNIFKENRQKLEDFYKRYKVLLLDIGVIVEQVSYEDKKAETPESQIKTLREDEETFILKYEEDSRHVFTGLVGDWFVTMGNQEYAKDIPEVARWYVFVNNLAYKDNHNRYKLRTISYNFIQNIDKDNVIRRRVKFFTGTDAENKPIFKTYDEIQVLPIEEKKKAEKEASDDIKIIAVNNKDSSPVLVTEHGLLTTDDKKDHLFFTSMATATEETANDFTRKSTKTFEERQIAILQHSKKAKATDEEKVKIHENAEKLFLKTLEEYKVFREEFKSDKSFEFSITGVNPGVKVKEVREELNIEEATNKPTKLLSFYLPQPKRTKEGYEESTHLQLGGIEHTVRPGFLYVAYKNRYELVRPKTLGQTNDVDNIVNLISYMYSAPKDEAIAIEAYLKEIIYFNNKADGFRFYFKTSGKPGIIFGQEQLSVEDLKNNKGVAKLKDFLQDKYWNFNKKITSSQNEAYTEYSIVNKTLKRTTWSAGEGGYRAFLFSKKKGNSPKGTIFIKALPETGGDYMQSQDPQYINQSITFTQKDFKEAAPKEKPAETPIIQPTVQPTAAQGTLESYDGQTVIHKTTGDEFIFEVKKYPTGKVIYRLRKTDGSLTPKIKGSVTAIGSVLTIKSMEELTNLFKLPEIEISATVIEQKEPTKVVKPEQPPIEEDTDVVIWENLAEGVQKMYIKTHGNKEAAKAAYNALIGRDRLMTREIQAFEREDMATARKWFQQKFPDFPLHIVEGLIDGKSWGRLVRGSHVLLSNVAEHGTVYHEAFHVIDEIFLTTEERNSLYNEVRVRLGKPKMSEDVIKELLAEEFREFMISPDNYTFTVKEEVQKGWFNKVVKWLKQIVGNILGFSNRESEEKSIEQLFIGIQESTFTLVTDRASYSTATLDRIKSLSNSESLAMLQDINHKFFGILLNPYSIQHNDIVNFNNTNLREVYSQLEEHLKINKEFGVPRKLPDIYDFLFDEKGIIKPKEWDDLVKEHIRFLKQYNIRATYTEKEKNEVNGNPEVEVETEEDDRVADTTIYRESVTVNPIVNMPDGIKLLIAGLLDVRSGKAKTISKFGTSSTVNFHRYISLLNRRLAQITTFKEMISTLEELSVNYPSLKRLINLLGINQKASVSNTQIELQNQFYRTFSHNKNNPLLTIITTNGKRYSLNAMDDLDSSITYNTWKNNARELIDEPGSFITRDTKGGASVKIKPLINQLQADIKITNNYQRTIAFLKTLERMGVVVTHDTDKLGDTKAINDYAKRLLEQLLEQPGTLSIDDLFNRDVVQNQKEVKALIGKTLETICNNEELSYYNQDGNQEWIITVPSHLSNTTNRLNGVHMDEDGNIVVPENIKHLQPYNGVSGSLYSLYSKYWDNLEGNIPIELVLLKGHKTDAGKGKEIQKGTPGDYKCIIFNNVLNNVIPLLRAADRSSEYGLKSGETNSNITDGGIVDHMIDYLRGELITSFALHVKPESFGGDLLYYKDKAKDVRTFQFLYDKDLNKKLPNTIENFLTTSVDFNALKEKFAGINNKNILEPLNHLVEQFIDENLDIIQTNINNYIEDSVTKTLDSLIEDKIFKPLPTVTRTQNYLAPGINSEFFITYGNDTGKFNETQIRRMVKIANYNYFVGTQEQLKLYVGDIANFENSVAFHKRMKGVGSTKYDTRNDIELIEELNKRWPMFTGKHSTTVGKTVVQDIAGSNSDLGKIFSEYNNIKEVTDAQSWGSLDTIRSFLIRHGKWGNKEETYQFEMQNFALKLLSDSKYQKYQDILGIDESIFTDEDGVFYKHTGGEVPSKPMYKGKFIEEAKCPPIPITKPMGYGVITDSHLNATSYFKTSLAPIFLSALTPDNPMLEAIVHMMKNDVGILNFHSSEKNTVRIIKGGVPTLFNKNGTINKVVLKNKNAQFMNWDDFGEQLDMQEEPKGRVTKSTQRARYEFLDVFEQGGLIKKDAFFTEVHNEFNHITNAITGHKRRELLKELGVTEIKHEGDEIDYNIADIDVFKTKLISAFENRLLPYNIIDGIDLALKGPLKILDVTVNKNKIEEVLLAIVKNTLTPGKINGELLVQESSVLYNEDLKFYSQNKDGSVNPMEVMIALPAKWNKWVERIGGLDMLNHLIAAKNTAMLGDDFHKLLELPGVRIPAHGLNSMEAMVVKKFLPTYHSTKIVLPKEIVVKTGSDFDIDKLTVYFNHFTLNDKGQPEYIENITSLEGLENRYNKLISKTLLHGERFRELIRPTDAKTLERLAKDIAKLHNKEVVEKPTLTELTEMPTNFKKAQEFWASKAGVAFVAIQGTAHASSQIYPIRMNSLIPVQGNFKGHFFFAGQQLEEEEQYNSGHLTDGGGHRISTNIAEFLTAFVDAVNNPFIFNIANDDTFGIYAILNRFGKDRSINIESIAHFITQDEIIEYESEIIKNKSDFLKRNGYNGFTFERRKDMVQYTADIYKNIFQKLWQNESLSKEGQYPRNWEDTAAYSAEQMLKSKPGSERYKQHEAKIMSKFQKYDYKYFSLKELKKHNFTSIKDRIQVLDNYIMYKALSWQLVNLNQVTRPDAATNAPKNLSDVQTTISKLDNIKERELFDSTSIDALLGLTQDSNAPLQESYQTHITSFKTFGQLFLTKKYPILRQYVYNYIEKLNDPAKFINKEDKRKIVQELENKLTTFLLTRMLGNEQSTKKHFKQLFVASKSVAQELLKLKVTHSDNFAISQLEPIIKQIVKREGRPSEVDNISTFNRGHNVFDIDAVVAGIEDLYNDPNTKEFAKQLAFVALFQSGLGTSYLSFFDKIPNFILTDIITKYLEEFTNKDEQEQWSYLDNFDRQFPRNEVNNTLLTPRLTYTQHIENANNPIEIALYDWRVNYEYIAARIELVTRSEAKKLRNEDKVVPTKLGLYRRTISPESATTKKISFVPIATLGDGLKFTEFYSDVANPVSILEKNQISGVQEGIPITPKTTEQSTIEPAELDKLESGETMPDMGEHMADEAAYEKYLEEQGLAAEAKKFITSKKGNLYTLESKKEIAKDNSKEYNKENTLEHSIEDILQNFEKYYPSEAWMNEVERRAFVIRISRGDIEQMCGF